MGDAEELFGAKELGEASLEVAAVEVFFGEGDENQVGEGPEQDPGVGAFEGDGFCGWVSCGWGGAEVGGEFVGWDSDSFGANGLEVCGGLEGVEIAIGGDDKWLVIGVVEGDVEVLAL